MIYMAHCTSKEKMIILASSQALQHDKECTQMTTEKQNNADGNVGWKNNTKLGLGLKSY